VQDQRAPNCHIPSIGGRLKRQVMAWQILVLFEYFHLQEICPSDAAMSGVRSYTNKIAINKHIVSYLDSRVRVMNAGAFEQGPVTHDRRFLMALI
jgi:hypothetical protein